METNATLDLELWRKRTAWFRAYPDYYYKAIESPEADFGFNYYQVVYLRGMTRVKTCWVDGTRGTTKTYLDTASGIHRCIFYPGTVQTLIAPTKEQSKTLVVEALRQLEKNYPLIKKEYEITTNSAYAITLTFYNGSKFRTLVNGPAAQGGNHTNLCVEEQSQPNFNIVTYAANVLPGVRLKRYVAGALDPNEQTQRYTHLTNAASRQTHAYSVRKAVAELQYDGGDAVVFGNTWRLPVMFGVRDMAWVDKMRSEMSALDFMQQMESVWTGTNANAIVRDEVLTAQRKLKVMENRHSGEADAIYVLAYDIAREDGSDTAKSTLVAIKMTPIPADDRCRTGTAIFYKDIVYIYSMQGTAYDIQARFLKQKVEDFKAWRLVIDANSYGTGVRDELIRDLGDGYPPYGVVNDPRMDKYRMPNSVDLLYCMIDGTRGNPTAEMITTTEVEFEQGRIRLLCDSIHGVSEYKIKNRIKDGYRDVEISRPYEETDILCQQISNLKKITEGHGVKERRINSSIQRDAWSALKYGIWVARQREIEELGTNGDWEEIEAEMIEKMKRRSARTKVHKRRGFGMRSGRIQF